MKLSTTSNILLDPRVSKLFLLESQWSVLFILVAYIYFVTGKGQSWMEKRKPFELTKLINAYNIFQVVANLYVFLMVCEAKYVSRIYEVVVVLTGMLSPAETGEFSTLLHTEP